MAAKIRSIRKPVPYKGKGIKYSDEFIRRKAGKSIGIGEQNFLLWKKAVSKAPAKDHAIRKINDVIILANYACRNK